MEVLPLCVDEDFDAGGGKSVPASPKD